MKRILLFLLCLLVAVPATASQLLTNPKFITLDDSGVPMQGCIYTYEAGGTTAKVTYSEQTLTTANTNPIQADARGECGLIYFEGLLSIVVTNPNAEGTCYAIDEEGPQNVEYTLDNLEGQGSSILDFQLLSDYTTFHAALLSIGSTPTELWIDEDATLTANEVVPTTLKLRFISPANIITLGAFNLTINGPFEAGLYQTFSQTGVGVVTLGTGSVKEVCPVWFGAKGDGVADDTAAIQSALNQKGHISISSGTYITSGLDLYEETNVEGIPGATILKMASGGTYILSINEGTGGTTSTENNQKNIRITGITFEGRSVEDGFSEHKHNLNVNAVSDLLVDNCAFKAFQGDGIYVGSSNVAGTERHNQRVTVRKCFFDGTNNQNRNAISVIDCDHFTAEDNEATRIGYSSAYCGGILIEPDAYTFAVIKDIRIKHNKIYAAGGIWCLLHYRASELTTPHKGIFFESNTIDTPISGHTGIAIVGEVTGAIAETDAPLGVVVTNNSVRGVTGSPGIPFEVLNVNGATITGNTFDGSDYGILIGYPLATINLCNVVFSNNLTRNIGVVQGFGISIYSVTNLLIESNTFIDSKTYAIYFNGTVGVPSTSSGVRILNNVISTPNALTTQAFVINAYHTLAPATNELYGNLIPDALNTDMDFKAYRCDLSKENTYDTTVLPDSFPIGVSISDVTGDAALPDAIHDGILETHKFSSVTAYRKFIIQWYYTADNDAATLSAIYFRKASTAANTWSAWQELTGVPVVP